MEYKLLTTQLITGQLATSEVWVPIFFFLFLIEVNKAYTGFLALLLLPNKQPWQVQLVHTYLFPPWASSLYRDLGSHLTQMCYASSASDQL